MTKARNFELTYGTMFSPPEELHTLYEKALETIEAKFGTEYPMLINGENVYSDEKFEDTSPIDTNLVLGVIQKGNQSHARQAVEAAHLAFKTWKNTPWQERISLVRKAADLIDERLFELSAVLSYEVGKNRLEALADIAESAALMRYACDQMEENNGFVIKMGKDPIKGYDFSNVSKLKPFGVWLVISPFNFPGALSYGPVGAALVAGNTVVLKPAMDTSLITYLIAEAFQDAGFPAGVFNFVSGSGSKIGNTLVDSPEIAGVTFTGSYDVGMGIYRKYANGKWVRPIILELGGKNPVIVTKNADLQDAATGIVRSAFGLQGQKCSANSRIYIHKDVYSDLMDRLVEQTSKLVVGNPTNREVFMGPVINKNAYRDYQDYVSELSQSGEILFGGKVLTDDELGKGYFAAPTLVADLPLEHRLWKHEMFLPISTLASFDSLYKVMDLCNEVDYGLTAGIYGNDEEAEWFFENIEAGVIYANRPQGSTTGAWPGYQPFGGWKGSGSSSKNAGGWHYLQLYMHEQSQTFVKHV